MNSENSERKVRKPLMEKKRRERINNSLEILKQIILQNNGIGGQGAKSTKLEKADILEMTVRYIEMLHDKLATVKMSTNVIFDHMKIKTKPRLNVLSREFLNENKENLVVVKSHKEGCCSNVKISAFKDSQPINKPVDFNSHWRPW